VKARIDALAFGVVSVIPCAYAVLLGMMLQQVFGSAK